MILNQRRDDERQAKDQRADCGKKAGENLIASPAGRIPRIVSGEFLKCLEKGQAKADQSQQEEPLKGKLARKATAKEE